MSIFSEGVNYGSLLLAKAKQDYDIFNIYQHLKQTKAVFGTEFDGIFVKI